MSIVIADGPHFVYYQSVNAHPDVVAQIAGAIGEPARARMLYSLVDGQARTSTELAMVAEVTPGTASVHLSRLRETGLLTMVPQGKHRYFRLAGADVAGALESLSVLAGFSPKQFVPTTPVELRAARTCYDHIAGRLGVLLHDRLRRMAWIVADGKEYDLAPAGIRGVVALGIDLERIRAQRRKFAYPCLDWSERRPHLAGALAAALLDAALRSGWLKRDPAGRTLEVTRRGRGELRSRLGIDIAEIE